MCGHRDVHPRISLVVRGYLIEWTADRAVLAGPGDVVSKPGWALHANRFGAEPVVMLSILADNPRAAPPGFDHTSHAYRWLPSSPLGIALRAVALSLESRRGPDADTAWSRLVAALDHEPPPRRWAAAERVSAACAHIAAEGAAGLRIEQVARTAGIHPVYLTRLFLAGLGCTPSAYLQRIKLAIAVDLLSTTRRSAADVAAAAGFADQAHLCRTLRRRVGVTPRALQRWPRLGAPPLDRAVG
jgi:AraC-like DNA-binding protein